MTLILNLMSDSCQNWDISLLFILGQQLIIGDNSGSLHIYDVNESLYNVRSGEWDDFSRFSAPLFPPPPQQFNF